MAWSSAQADNGDKPLVSSEAPSAVTKMAERAEARSEGEAEQDAEVLTPAERANAPWVLMEVAGAPYDARKELYIGRVQVAGQLGYRFDEFGLFLNTEYDVVREFTSNSDTLKMLNVGLGVEWLNYLGRLKTSVMAGTSTLLADTVIDEAGTTGWFIDIRPAALRWPIGDNVAFQLTPLSFDLSSPVTEGIPLVLTSYMTLAGLEWSAQ